MPVHGLSACDAELVAFLACPMTLAPINVPALTLNHTMHQFQCLLCVQSSVTCHKCGGRFTMYEPFWDLRCAPLPASPSLALLPGASLPSPTLHFCLVA